MVESWNIGIQAHDSYAKRVEGLREFEQSLRLAPSESGRIATHTTILKLRPEIPQIILLMRLDKRKTWAGFSFPEAYYLWRRRRSYFLAPNEKLFADRDRIASYLEQHGGYDEDEQEGKSLMEFFEEVAAYNDLVSEVEARTKQFLQG